MRRWRRFRVFRWLLSALDRLRAFFYARDVFISYSHRDARYAEALAERLQARRVVFLDQDLSRAEERTPRSVLWHARHARVLVVLATANAVASREVTKEIRLARFRAVDRVVPVVPRETIRSDMFTKPPWPAIRAATPELQEAAEIEDGIVADDVVRRIVRVIGIYRWSVRIAVAASLAALFVIGGGALALFFFVRAAEAARAARASGIAGEALNLIGTDQHREALRLAAAAYDEDPGKPSYAVKSALLRAVLRYPDLLSIHREPEAVHQLARLGHGRVAAITGTNVLRFIELETGRSEEVMRFGNIVMAMEASPSGRWVATAAADSDGVVLWDVASRTRVARIAPRFATMIRFASDDRVFCDQDDELQEIDIRDPHRPRVVTAMRLPEQPAACEPGPCVQSGIERELRWRVVDVDPIARLVALGHPEGRIALLEWPSGKLLRYTHEFRDQIALLHLGGDGTLVASNGMAFIVRATADGRRVYDDCDAGATSAASAGTRTAIASGARAITFDQLRWFGTLEYGHRILSVAPLDAVAQRIAAGSEDGTVTEWNVREWSAPPASVLVRRLTSARAEQLAFSTDGGVLVAGKRRQLDRRYPLGRQSPEATAPYAFITHPARGVRVVDALRGATIWDLPLPAGLTPLSVVASGDGSTVAASFGREIRIWDVGTAQPREVIRSANERRALALTFDGRTLAAAGKDGVISLTGGTTARLRANRAVDHLAITPDGEMVAAAERVGEELTLYDVRSGRAIGVLPQNTGALAFDPSGTRLAVSYAGISVWDTSPASWREHAVRLARLRTEELR